LGYLGGASAGFMGSNEPTLAGKMKAANQLGQKGFNLGAKGGVRAAGFASRSIGANQPDILNPVTTIIDKRYNPEGARRDAIIQNLEDAVDRVSRGGLGRPEATKKP